jgi:trehalose utilization protein
MRLEVGDHIDTEDIEVRCVDHNETIIIDGSGLGSRIVLHTSDSLRLHKLLTAAICTLQPLDDSDREAVERFKLNVERSQADAKSRAE